MSPQEQINQNELVSCIMPTANRRSFVPLAIQYFLAQNYPNKELIILDDGDDNISDLIPDHPLIHYYREPKGRTLGEKRNRLCELANGKLIAHWDDDDWYSSNRLTYQLVELLSNHADVCGVSHLLFYDHNSHKAWKYTYPKSTHKWLSGASLVYKKKFWQKNKFSNLTVGEDAKFIWQANQENILDLKDSSFIVASVHKGNSSPRHTNGTYWNSCSVESVEELIGEAIAKLDSLGKVRSKNTRNAFNSKIETVENGAREIVPLVDSRVATEGVSAIVVHGGAERLPNLAGTIANLKQLQMINQIIIVDVGDKPFAYEVGARWCTDYVYSPSEGLFNRARAINIGCGLARNNLLLWCDNDLLFSTSFIENAVTELLTQKLDFLIPYSQISYLSKDDSLAVIAGTKGPIDCKPLVVLNSGRGGAVDGGVGLVRANFVKRYGAMCEDFRGWGGEDNAWTHKVSVLGRFGVTKSKNQTAFHLYHSGSGGLGGDPWQRNPKHYDNNLALLQEILKYRNQDAYLDRYPAPKYYTCPWSYSKKILIVGQSDNSNLAEQQRLLVSSLAETYGIVPRVIGPQQIHKTLYDDDKCADAIVAIGKSTSLTLLNDERLKAWWDRIIVLLEQGIRDVSKDREVLSRAAINMTAEPGEHASLRVKEFNIWHVPWATSVNSSMLVAPPLVQPLSLVFASQKLDLKGDNLEHSIVKNTEKQIPVWMYWEGDRPDWIQKCEQTVLANADDVRIIGPKEFDQLWDRDRDINLTRLHVVQRADYIRAFLLARYGGLWIDSDCIVMKPLAPVLHMLKTCEFVAHKERKGWYCNDFMGAPPDSRIAKAIYKMICQQLRTNKEIGWTALGCEVVTAVLGDTEAPWQELSCELVQPICWSNPGPYFKVATPEEHKLNLDNHAYCYMLSNQEAIKYSAKHPGHDLMNEGTFFRYLIDDSLRTDSVVSYQKSAVEHIPFFLDAMASIAPTSVLDIGVDSGRWALLFREVHRRLSISSTQSASDLRINGIMIEPAKPQKIHKLLYDSVVTTNIDRLEYLLVDNWGLVIISDELEELPKDLYLDLFNRVIEVADYVLLGRWLQEQSITSVDINSRYWRFNDLIDSNVVRHTLCHQNRGVAYGAFLFSRHDPLGLKPKSPIKSVFARMINECSKLKMESVSGPGSSLVQTNEIRQRLPHLLQNIQANSLLDAPCGDFHWMSHTNLGIEKYTGVDILDDLIKANQQQYGRNSRNFLCLDLTRDKLPRADVIFCRDCLVHFSFSDIQRTLANFKRSGAIYLLTTTFTHRTSNTDIVTGDWQPFNFELAPFWFPPPIKIVIEKCTENDGKFSDKSLGLWRFSDLTI